MKEMKMELTKKEGKKVKIEITIRKLVSYFV